MPEAQSSGDARLAGIQYAECEPAPALATHVLAYWSFTAGPEVTARSHMVWPDGCPSLLMPAGAPVPIVFGPRTTPYETPTFPGMRVWGVRFWPDVGAGILGRRGPELRDVSDMAPSTFADFGQVLHDVRDEATAWSRIEQWCFTRVEAWPTPEPRVRRAVNTLAATAGAVSLGALAVEAGASARHLQRLFREATGLSIKEYARIRRYRTALTPRLGRPAESWSQVAAKFGFSDHAHLTRELRALTGDSPSLAAERIAQIRHVNVKP